ncbi:MAG: phosphoenolpyruvate carboxylase, partial [Pseudomonadota bacterium]
KETLQKYAADIDSDPQTNSVRRLSIDLFRALEDGALSDAELEDAVELLGASALADRLERFRSMHRLLSEADPWAEVRAQLYALTEQGFDAYRAGVERVAAGVVFTAHPTFALPRSLRQRFADAAADPTQTPRAAMELAVREEGMLSPGGVTLKAEHDEVQAALAHGRQALKALWALTLEIGQGAFPDQWRDLRPAIINLASWVGYDLDGRTDIHWGDTLALRFGEKAVQLERYAERLKAICGRKTALKPLKANIDICREEAAVARDAAKAFVQTPRDTDWLVTCAQQLERRSHEPNLREMIDALETAAKEAAPADAAALIGLVAEMRAFGLGTARIHLRINAAQIRVVLAQDFPEAVAADDDAEIGRAALAAIAERADAPHCAAGGVADLFEQRTTARRQFMLCRLLLSEIDEQTPIRFLVAESENPATIMGALYLARQYGVEDQVDISPLFETPDALERGGRFVVRLLKEPAFVKYIRGRGRLCLQFGFSDSGRYAGQIGAEMAIERIHNLVGAALADHGLSNIELVLFNTHGESMGRGAYPGGFQQRFSHLLSPWTRAQIARFGVALTHEFSFQGGDGYLHFANDRLAQSTIAEAALHALSPPEALSQAEAEDPFYAERDFTWDIYRTLRSWHERLFENADYARAALEFGPGLLVVSGSRKARRQTGASAGQAGLSSLRAIPQNAILQQLAIPLNVACGLGSSTGGDPDRFAALIKASPRMRQLADMAITARAVTSLPAFRGYARLYDPSFWNAIAKRSDRATAQPYRDLSEIFADYEVFTAISKLADILTLDLSRFDRILPHVEGALPAEERRMDRLDLHCLHAVRQALMARAMTLAATAPTVSRRHDAARSEDLIGMAAQMRLGELADRLCEIFPKADSPDPRLEPYRDAADGDAEPQGYDDLHRDIIEPLRRLDAALKLITIAIACHYNAYG